jgi:hypothetical protein
MRTGLTFSDPKKECDRKSGFSLAKSQERDKPQEKNRDV